MASFTISREAYEHARKLDQNDIFSPAWDRRQYHLGSHVVIHEPDPVGPWYLRWCTPDGSSTGELELTAVDRQADPMEHAAADELCRYQERKHPTFLWFVSNERAPRLVRP